MRSLRFTIIAILLGSLATTNLFAGFLTGALGKNEPQQLRWKSGTIKIAASSSLLEPNTNIKTDSDVLGALERSIAAWESVANIEIQLEFSDKQNVSSAIGPDGVSPAVNGDGVSLVTIAQSAENVLLFSKDPQAESAKTRVFYNGKNGKYFVTEADIVLNPFQQFSTDGTFGTFDLESTLTHEIGHLLGLRHSSVRGAAMSDSLSKNGTFGLSSLDSRTLAETDIAAIRELYGVGSETCCAAIAGKLTANSAKAFKDIRVWAEESRTGRVAAQVEAGPDGGFRLGGLQAGTYSVFWQKDSGLLTSPVGSLGAFTIEKDETRTLFEKVSVGRSDVRLNFVGINRQLSDSAVAIDSGREYTVYLGGKNLDAAKITIEFNSPFLTVSPETLTKQDFGEDVSVINFVLAVHAETPRGVYSIFATGKDGTMNSLIGALNVR